MWNGRKKAAIGLRALLAFVLLELAAVIGGVAVLLGVVMDVDLPLFAIYEAERSVPIFGDSGSFCAVSGSLKPGCQRQAPAAIIKIVMIQRPFKFSLS